MPFVRNPSIVAVIPVKNGFPEIKDCVEGLLHQTIPIDRILVIDSGSTDGTLEYLQGIGRVQILHIPSSQFNHGATRNLGWQHSTEEFLLYTVQDAKPASEYFLEDMLKGFTDDAVAGVCGQQIVPHDLNKNPVEWFRPVGEPLNLRFQYQSASAFDALSPEEKKRVCAWDDVAALYRRSVLESNPFQPLVFGEDMIWAKEVLRKGFAIAYRQSARVYHYHLENPDFTFRRTFTTLYFRFKHFNYVPPEPRLDFRRKLSILKTLIKSVGLKPKVVFKWFEYNMNLFDAYRRSHREFVGFLKQGHAELDAAHERYCGKPTVPSKLELNV